MQSPDTEHQLAESYSKSAEQYRRNDEIEVATAKHRRSCARLAGLTSSWNRPVTVLEAGCGSGRYFHALTNTARLVGLDLSPDMLKLAEKPVLAHEITIGSIELRCASIHTVDLPPGTFDVIYSLGMFGFGCPVSNELLDRFHGWLTPGGKLLFNVPHISTLSWPARIKRALRQGIRAIAPSGVRAAMDRRERIPFRPISSRQLAKIIATSRFRSAEVTLQPCDSQFWHGSHLECLATRE